MAKKKHFKFPTAYTVIIIVLFAVELLTLAIPSGKYATMQYDHSSETFLITQPSGKKTHAPATQKTLNRYHIKMDAKKLIDGTVYKPVAIPNTYQQIKKKRQTLWTVVVQFLTSQVNGIADSIDIIAFVLILGGCIGVIHANGSLDSGMQRLSEVIKGKQALLIVIVMGLIALGGTTFGLAEETMAFYPILIPVFLLAGYDTLTVVATVFLGSALGTMGSTVNPFSVVIASNAAGINFSSGLGLRIAFLVTIVVVSMIYVIHYAEKVRHDPAKSLVADQYQADRDKFLDMDALTSDRKFTWRQKLTLLVFAAAFVIMVWGVQQKGWYFTEITVVFLGCAYIFGFISGLSESKFMDSFVAGACDLLGVALTIGLARSVSIVLEESNTSDTLMHAFASKISGMSPLMFVWCLFVVYIILGFFIQSSSGLAVLSMPIMAPLADVVGVDRANVINAYNWGQGFISFLAPTGLILMSLAMAGIGFDRWLKWIWKLLIILFVLALIFLAIGLL